MCPFCKSKETNWTESEHNGLGGFDSIPMICCSYQEALQSGENHIKLTALYKIGSALVKVDMMKNKTIKLWKSSDSSMDVPF